MIRFVIERHEVDFNLGIERKDFITSDYSLLALEELLQMGGKGEMGFLSYRLLGCEIVDGGQDEQ